ncbi:Xaa-Pro peptidase family protein [Alphaproteobacteria bacterium]|nr:Xaa-Pro peptidase family protein [Alphaproteobacteria bacterium]
MFQIRIDKLRKKLIDNDIDIALITDDDSVYYYTGYYDYLHMDFGRPTILLIPKDDQSILITPLIDIKLLDDEAVIDKVLPWNDGVGKEWKEHLPSYLTKDKNISLEYNQIPALVRNYIYELIDENKVIDVTPIISEMRMIKSMEELKIARHAGEVANTMMQAAKNTIADGVPEYEIALSTSSAGTKKASELLNKYYQNTRMSPYIHFLQIMASGNQMPLTHHRASNKIINYGDPVFICFCGMANFHRFKLGFDRTFWLGEIKNKLQIKTYEVAVNSQAAALDVLTPGIRASAVHAAYAESIQSEGYPYPTFRCGRSTGFSFLEHPQLVVGDETIIKPGMVFAVDGSANSNNFRAQVGDTFIITDNGYEQITSFSKSLSDVVI